MQTWILRILDLNRIPQKFQIGNEMSEMFFDIELKQVKFIGTRTQSIYWHGVMCNFSAVLTFHCHTVPENNEGMN